LVYARRKGRIKPIIGQLSMKVRGLDIPMESGIVVTESLHQNWMEQVKRTISHRTSGGNFWGTYKYVVKSNSDTTEENDRENKNSKKPEHTIAGEVQELPKLRKREKKKDQNIC